MLLVSGEVSKALREKRHAELVGLDPNLVRFHLSFQSRVGPVPWLQPYTEDAIKRMGDGGVTNLMVVPIAFVSEHIETLEEIDGEYR
jgi:ferrochelatase